MNSSESTSSTVDHNSSNDHQRKLVTVLAYDGGGARGVIPAYWSMKFEELLGAPIASYFDLVAGTSTGGLIALGHLMPNADESGPEYTSKKIFDIYAGDTGAKIFSRSLWHSIISGFGVSGPKYSAHGLEEVLEEQFGDTMGSRALTDFLIPTYVARASSNILASAPSIFTFERNQSPSFLFRSIARATSAATTYFPAAQIKSKEGDEMTCVDGGLWANNPAGCAYAKILEKYPNDDVDIMMFSIGTGTFETPVSDKKLDGGLLGSVPSLIDMIFDGQSDGTDYFLKKILANKEGTPNYYRFQPILTQNLDVIDDVSLLAREAYVKTAEKQWAKDIDTISKMVNVIKQRKKQNAFGKSKQD